MTDQTTDPVELTETRECLPTAVATPGSLADCRPHIVIERETGFRLLDLRDLWRYRDLVWLLAERDLKARYRQSLLGAAWAIVQPLLTLAIFLSFFTLLGQKPSAAGVPYALSLLCAIVPWNFFSGTLTATSSSLPTNVFLINKIYCPRLVFPLSSVAVALVDFVIACLIVAVGMIGYGHRPGLQLAMLPVFVFLTGLTALAVGLWISALSVRWRDLRFTVPALLQMWFFASPVVYETGALVPEKWRVVYHLNPMAGILDGFRWCLLGGEFSWQSMAISGPATLLVLVTGLFLFRRVERTLPDYL